MALFEDKRKPVDIYKQGSATANAQGKMNALASRAANAVTAPARTAANVGILAPAKRLMTDVVAPAAQAVAKPIMQGRENQNRFMAGQELNRNITPASERQAIGAITGPNFERKIGAVGQRFEGATPIPRPMVTASNPRGKVSNMGDLPPSIAERGTAAAATLPQPQQQAMNPPKQSSGALDQLLEPQTKTVYTNQGGKIVSQQQPIRPGSPVPSASEQAAPVSALSRRAGNLDIQFEPGTDPAAIQRFMENPVRPTAQINRFEAGRGFEAGKAQRQAEYGARVLGPNNNLAQQQPMGWKSRLKLAEQAMQNEQAEANNRNTFNVARMNDATNREQNAINRFSNEATAKNNAEKNRIDAETLAAGQPLRDAQSKYYGAQAEDLPARREVDEKKIGVQDDRNRIMAEKNQLDVFHKIEDPVEKTNYALLNYNPEGPPSDMQNFGKAAVQKQSQELNKYFKDNSGWFKDDPTLDIISQFFPRDLPQSSAKAILDNVQDEGLKKKLGKALFRQYNGE